MYKGKIALSVTIEQSRLCVKAPVMENRTGNRESQSEIAFKYVRFKGHWFVSA